MSLHCLMFGWEYPPVHSGGLGVACQGLVRGLLKNGVRVTLVLPVAGSSADTATRTPGDGQCAVVRIDTLLDPYEDEAQYATKIGNLPRESRQLYGPDMSQAVDRFTEAAVAITKDLKPDVIHCHDWMTYGAGVRAARHHGRPLVSHIHATEFDRTDFRPNPWIADRERKGLFDSNRIIAVSNYTKNIVANHYGVPPEKIAVVHNGHEAPTVTAHAGSRIPTKRGPLVLFLGRLTVHKNPWQFLEVAKRVRGMRNDVQFVMAGDGPMLPGLIERSCRMGLQDCFVFTGKVHGEEVEALYRAADCFVMPSLSEPFGLVALEASGHGVPVIVSKQSGVSEVLRHCFAVDFWDSDKMADCILTILRDKTLASQLKSEAPRILQQLTWQNQAGQVLSIYHNLLKS